VLIYSDLLQAPGVIVLTYDDGPYNYTQHILDILDAYNVKATFFITGNNLGKGQIDNAATPWPALIRQMHSAGHQIASHTWGHQNLSSLTQAQRLAQMYNNEIAFNNILGMFPTYMRPPYSSCTPDCEKDMEDLGYHIISFDLDTEDYLHDSPTEIQISKNDFLGNISSLKAASGADWLVISHDIQEQTSYNLTQYMIETLLSQGYKPVTVGECLEDPPSNWYRSLGGGALLNTRSAFISSSASSLKASKAIITSNLPTASSIASVYIYPSPSLMPTNVSRDGTCGGIYKTSCIGSSFGNCCSQYSWCGNTTAYCGQGCQPQFGSCS
jgi:peptidoglycan/xylan/chitin deacetylase (PgdA/CDA1 family)